MSMDPGKSLSYRYYEEMHEIIGKLQAKNRELMEENQELKDKLALKEALPALATTELKVSNEILFRFGDSAVVKTIQIEAMENYVKRLKESNSTMDERIISIARVDNLLEEMIKEIKGNES